MTVVQRVRRTVERHALCPSGMRLLVALSGGSDSVALLWIMLRLSELMSFRVVGVAHLNHQLRPTAERDETFCRHLADRVGVPIVVATRDVRAYAAENRLSLENAARRLRYDFLATAADQLSADAIATGHTRDDQVETLILKLCRGAGAAGLGGIYRRRGAVVRPLLEASRAELRAFLQSRSEPWVEDETNAQLSTPRHRVRHLVLPRLDEVFGPAARVAIARAASNAQDDAVLLDSMAAEQLERLCVQFPDRRSFDMEKLRALPPALTRRVLLNVMRSSSGGREVVLEHVEASLDVLFGRRVAADFHGGRCELSGESLVFLERNPPDPVAPFLYCLNVPGSVAVPEAGCRILAESVASLSSDSQHESQAMVAHLGVDQLTVRSRRPGDRLRVPGLKGTKKLQDLLVDAKVPREDRDRLPLVVTPDDRVVWVPGHAISADFQASGTGVPMILLSLTRFGGTA